MKLYRENVATAVTCNHDTILLLLCGPPCSLYFVVDKGVLWHTAPPPPTIQTLRKNSPSCQATAWARTLTLESALRSRSLPRAHRGSRERSSITWVRLTGAPLPLLCSWTGTCRYICSETKSSESIAGREFSQAHRDYRGLQLHQGKKK